MTTEDLMKPRYKVIADYFYNPYKIGDIITVLYDDRSVHLTTTHYRDEFGGEVEQANCFNPKRLNDYPHIFQPLEWWQERAIGDLPEYVKVTREDCAKDTGLYCRVHKWSPIDNLLPSSIGEIGAELEGYEPSYLCRPDLNFPGQRYGRLNAVHLLPATEADYNAYLQTTNQLKDGQ